MIVVMSKKGLFFIWLNVMDEPFKAGEVRFWSVKTFPKFLFRGLPRLIMIFVFYIIIAFFALFFRKDRQNYVNQTLKWSTRMKMYFFGYKRINISNEDIEKIKNSKEQIIIANHSSYMDILLMSYLFPDAKFIASNYISKIPIIKKFGETKCIYLKDEFGGKLTDVIEDELQKGTKIIFFSEGVCCRSDILLKLRNGAFVPHRDILPVHIDYGENYWVMGEQDMLLHAFTQISNFKNNVKVKIGIPYKITHNDKKNIEGFKENFRKHYANIFNVKLSEKNYKDHPFYKLKL